MKFMFCPNCGEDIEVKSADKDELGWHTSCPYCEGSFDIDIEDFCVPNGTPVKTRDGIVGKIRGNLSDDADRLDNIQYRIADEHGTEYMMTRDHFAIMKDWRLTRRVDGLIERVCHYTKNQDHCNAPCYNCANRNKCNADIFERLAQYEDTGIDPDTVKEYKKFEDELVHNDIPFSKIIDMAKKYAAGELMFLPCKIGDTMYRVCRSEKNRTSKPAIFVRKVVLNQNNFWRIVLGGEYNETVFKDEVDAEIYADRMRKGTVK